MPGLARAGVHRLGDRTVRRLGYGAMQLAGPGAFGPPKDRATAVRVLREAVGCGVDHIDTSGYYGPDVVNEIIAEALHPYPQGLTIVTKVGWTRGDDGEWLPASGEDDLTRQVHDNLRRLRLEVLDVVNLRLAGERNAPAEGPLERELAVLADLQRQGLIRHLGLSNATSAQVAAAAAIAPVVCVQNHYNLAHRDDDALVDGLATAGIAYVPYFPLGGFAPLQSETLTRVAREIGATPMQTALAWLLARSPNVLPIPGTSSLAHLHENLAAARIDLSDAARAALDRLADQGR